MSQTNQIIAVLFPLLALVAADLTALAVRKPWRRTMVHEHLAVGPTTNRRVGTDYLVAAKELERRAHELAQDLERTLVR